MMLRFALIAAAAVAIFVSAPAPPRGRADDFTSGSITPNRGARGITLGMIRRQVVAKLGQPTHENENGYMEYDPPIDLDVYLNVSIKPARVQRFGIGDGCLVGGGPCLNEKGGHGKLRARYGTRLKTREIETGEQIVVLNGRFRGCKVFTDFGEAGQPQSGAIGFIFILLDENISCLMRTHRSLK